MWSNEKRRELFDDLVEGELVLVRFGSDGHQLAQFERKVRGNPDAAWVRKFRARSGRWTNPVQIGPADLVDPKSPGAKRAKARFWPKAKKAGAPIPVDFGQPDLALDL